MNRSSTLSILCLVLVPLTMAPRQKPEKISGGPIKASAATAPSVIEERDGSDTMTRQVVYGGGTALWQILADGSSQYFHEDPRGNIVMLTEGAGSPTASPGDVLERNTYDAYGKPFFQDAANQNKTDGGGNFLAKSDLGNTLLYMGRWYDPETGSRARSLSSDRGGLYDFGGRFLDPDEGRLITRSGPAGEEIYPDKYGRYGFAGHQPVSRNACVQYRESNLDFVSRAQASQTGKIHGYRTVGDVTLKRGVVGGRPLPGGPDTQDIGAPAAEGGPDTQDIGAPAAEGGPDTQDIGAPTAEGGPDTQDIGAPMAEPGSTTTLEGGITAEDDWETPVAGPVPNPYPNIAGGSRGASGPHGEFWFEDLIPGAIPSSGTGSTSKRDTGWYCYDPPWSRPMCCGYSGDVEVCVYF